MHTRYEMLLRDEEPCDADFLARLYASTREQEMLLMGWGAEQRAAFLSMQFQAQTMHYQRVYAEASRRIVLLDGNSAGRLYLFSHGGDLRIVDVSLLPQYRGQGVGTALLQSVLDKADLAGQSVSLNVSVMNPAQRLYQRLGFQQIAAGDGMDIPMRRPARSAITLGR